MAIDAAPAAFPARAKSWFSSLRRGNLIDWWAGSIVTCSLSSSFFFFFFFFLVFLMFLLQVKSIVLCISVIAGESSPGLLGSVKPFLSGFTFSAGDPHSSSNGPMSWRLFKGRASHSTKYKSQLRTLEGDTDGWPVGYQLTDCSHYRHWMTPVASNHYLRDSFSRQFLMR